MPVVETTFFGYYETSVCLWSKITRIKFSFFFQQNMALTIEHENISSYFGNAVARFK